MLSRLLPADEAAVTHAAALLRAGKLVAFPTETVYGLGADACQGEAVAAIYAAKGRPSFNPLIVHVADEAALDSLVDRTEDARLLGAAFWPGPLTLVLPRRPSADVSLLVSAGMDTLAVRIPAHPVALDLLRRVGRPIAAPSANESGRLSPTQAAHVAESLGDKVDLILDGGSCAVGVESTIVSLVGADPVILRPGGITHAQLESVLKRPVLYTNLAQELGASLPSPGLLTSHYAPHIPVRLNASAPLPTEAWLGFGADQGIVGGAARRNLSPRGDLTEAAATLFALMRLLDRQDFSAIAIAPIPETGLGVAINDRLRRAASLNSPAVFISRPKG